MAMNSTGTVMDCSAQTVELLLEHQSMPSFEFVERIACALRNDRSVKILVPVRNPSMMLAALVLGTSTLATTCVANVPSLRRSLAGLAVPLKYGRSGCVTNRADSELPAPEPGLPLRGMTTISSSG